MAFVMHALIILFYLVIFDVGPSCFHVQQTFSTYQLLG